MMTATGLLYLAKTAPLPVTTADGHFLLTLHALDRLGTHKVEGWRITVRDDAARDLWQQHQQQLCPGQPIRVVQASQLRTLPNGLGGAPEIHAMAERIELAPRSHDAVHPDTPPYTAASS